MMVFLISKYLMSVPEMKSTPIPSHWHIKKWVSMTDMPLDRLVSNGDSLF